MLLPQFSFRTLLIGIAIAAVGSLVAAAAVRGQHWAVSAAIGATSLLFCFILFFFAFALAFVFTAVVGLLRPRKRKTPFSTTAPQQVLPTQDAD